MNILEEELLSTLQKVPKNSGTVSTTKTLPLCFNCPKNTAFFVSKILPLLISRQTVHCGTLGVGIQSLQSLSKYNMATNVESEIVGGTESASTSETESDSSKCSPCTCMSLDKHEEARGVNFNGIGRGAISMSNVYLSNSLILLACIQAGGADPNNMRCIDQSVRVYGFRPASLISNIYAGAGLVAAFLMPVIGAMIDFSPHRKKIGVIMAVLLALISGIQIGTVEVRSDYSFLFLMVFLRHVELTRSVSFFIFRILGSQWQYYKLWSLPFINSSSRFFTHTIPKS